MRYVFMMALVVAFVALSLAADRPKSGVIAGAVIEWLPGESILVVNPQTDPGGVRVSLRDNTVYDGDIDAIYSGDVVVTIRYRVVGERYPVADKVWLRK